MPLVDQFTGISIKVQGKAVQRIDNTNPGLSRCIDFKRLQRLRLLENKCFRFDSGASCASLKRSMAFTRENTSSRLFAELSLVGCGG